MREHAVKSRLASGLALAGLLLVGAGCGNMSVNGNVNGSGSVNVNAPGNSGASDERRDFRQLYVDLNEQNSSGIEGKALLVEDGQQTRVIVRMDGAVEGSSHPAHIHVGSCPNPGAVTHQLSDVRDGVSETTIDATFESLLGKLPLAINVHKSAEEMSTYYACGDLRSGDVEDFRQDDESQMRNKPNVLKKDDDSVKTRATIRLATVGTLGASGTAGIRMEGDKTHVTISLQGGPAGAHPAHLQAGKCDKPGASKYELSDVVDGKSETTLDASVAEIIASGVLSISVRESDAKPDSVLACGDLPLWDKVKAMFKLDLN
jgi:hypothetical protein